jgi:hypothetical protein
MFKTHDVTGNKLTGEITGVFPAPADTGLIRKQDGYVLQDILAVVLQPEA